MFGCCLQSAAGQNLALVVKTYVLGGWQSCSWTFKNKWYINHAYRTLTLPQNKLYAASPLVIPTSISDCSSPTTKGDTGFQNYRRSHTLMPQLWGRGQANSNCKASTLLGKPQTWVGQVASVIHGAWCLGGDAKTQNIVLNQYTNMHPKNNPATRSFYWKCEKHEEETGTWNISDETVTKSVNNLERRSIVRILRIDTLYTERTNQAGPVNELQARVNQILCQSLHPSLLGMLVLHRLDVDKCWSFLTTLNQRWSSLTIIDHYKPFIIHEYLAIIKYVP